MYSNSEYIVCTGSDFFFTYINLYLQVPRYFVSIIVTVVIYLSFLLILQIAFSYGR